MLAVFWYLVQKSIMISAAYFFILCEVKANLSFFMHSCRILPFCDEASKWYCSAQSCLTLCYPVDCSLPGSSVHGIFQARMLERVAISFSRGSSQPRDQACVFCGSSRWILYHCTTWEAPKMILILTFETLWYMWKMGKLAKKFNNQILLGCQWKGKIACLA